MEKGASAKLVVRRDARRSSRSIGPALRGAARLVVSVLAKQNGRSNTTSHTAPATGSKCAYHFTPVYSRKPHRTPVLVVLECFTCMRLRFSLIACNTGNTRLRGAPD